MTSVGNQAAADLRHEAAMCPEIEAQRKRLDRRTIFLDEDQGLCTFGAGAAEARKAEVRV